MSAPTAKASKVWLVALPVAVAAAAFGLWTVTKGAPAKPKAAAAGAPATSTGAGDSSLAAIGVQQADLLEPSVKCPITGDMETHIQKMKEASPEVGESVANTWKQLQDHGATAGYVTYWGDTIAACNAITDRSTAMDHSPGSKHPTTTFSIVVRYQSPAGAESVFRDDVFGQTKLKSAPNFEVTSGETTGLGPNSVVGLTPKATIPIHQAVWQHGSVTVFYGSENLPITASRVVTESVNHRIG